MKRKLIISIAIIMIIAICLIVNHFINHTGEFINGKLYWKGSYYVETYNNYDYNEGERIGKMKDHSYNIDEVVGDEEHKFVVLRTFLDNWLYVSEDYKIPQSGEVTAVYIDDTKYDNKEFCEVIDDLIYGGFINDKQDKFSIKTDNIYYFADVIKLCFNGCPVGTEFVGYIGIINNKWVYIPIQKIETDKNGFEITTSFTCYVIEDYDKLPIIKEYYKPTNHDANSE